MKEMYRLTLAVLLFAGIAGAQETWNAGLAASPVGEFTHAEATYRSSSMLRVTWSIPERTVHHFVLTATEPRGQSGLDASGGAAEATFRALKAATDYEIRLRACLDERCDTFLEAERTATARTEAEYWRISGKGNSFATADRLVADGNVGSYAMKYGPWAGPDLDGKIQLYYTPLQQNEKGVKIAEMVLPEPNSLDAALAFRGISGYGLIRVCMPGPSQPGQPPNQSNPCPQSRSLATQLALYQAVPLPLEAGGAVRLFFEAQGYDGRTRILYLDSQDGYIGRDFHSGPPTRCNTLEDYSPGGGCEPKLAIGVDLDGNPNIPNARQFKIAYPTLDSWVWDMKPGTQMWFTTEWRDGRCSPFGFNIAFAVWNGEKWEVAYREDGCPKHLPGVQAPSPVHLGGGRYKLYFNRHSRAGGPTDPQVAIKPMQMLYADATVAGDPERTDFEDWEPLDSAREVYYLWPNGDPVSEKDESTLDDYLIFAPASDPARLIMYSNMSAASGPGILPFIGSAVLVNP